MLSTALIINLTEPSPKTKEHLSLKGSPEQLPLHPGRTTAPLVKIPLLHKEDPGYFIPHLQSSPFPAHARQPTLNPNLNTDMRFAKNEVSLAHNHNSNGKIMQCFI